MYAGVPIAWPNWVTKVLLGEPLAGGLGDAEVDDLGDGPAVCLGDQDVRGLEVAVDDALLVGVLDGAADRDEEGDAVAGGELVGVAVVGDRDAADQLHHEVGAAGVGRAGVEHLGDGLVHHHRQRLPLGLEAGHDLGELEAGPEDLQRHPAVDRRGLLGLVDHAHAALAEPEDPVGADLSGCRAPPGPGRRSVEVG